MTVSELESSDSFRTAVAPRRLEILELIWEEELPVSAIASELPVSVPAVSQHLAKLREAGLVAVRKEGRRRYYRAAHESMGGVSALLAPLLGHGPVTGQDADAAPAHPEVRGPEAETEAEADTGPEAVTPPVEALPQPVEALPEVEPAGQDGPEDAPVEAPPGVAAPESGFGLGSVDARPQDDSADTSRVVDEMASWYRQGLRGRSVALRAAREALTVGQGGAGASIRRIARSLTRTTMTERFPEVARSARALADEPDGALPTAAERLMGALSQEAARDDRLIARILLVEDSRVEAALTRSIVGGPNREVLWATSAEEAQRIVDRERVDLIILDLGLPGEDGRELLGRLGGRPLTAAIPVILLTGRTDVQTRTEVMSLGADLFFEKPADRALLSTAVAMLLERSAETRQAGRQDPLTGLSNRTVFLAEVRKVAASAARNGVDLTLAILDTQRLATINDLHGSDVGDGVVRSIARSIQSC
ncbi:MAG: metalloregulator ArsR/SmtB family transcription factor, partial [Longimicrobiales bacterium]|nr:metalloregulator ArsR/SmtB family transcription factor [Longimicrobiales bacterium]